MDNLKNIKLSKEWFESKNSKTIFTFIDKTTRPTPKPTMRKPRV